MKSFLIFISLLITTPALADKPSWAGQGGKPSKAEREMHKDAMRAKGGAKNNAKGMQHKGERDMDDRMEHQRGEYRDGYRDSKQEAERLKQQSPVENAHEAVHDAAQAHETTQNIKKWYEFWKK